MGHPERGRPGALRPIPARTGAFPKGRINTLIKTIEDKGIVVLALDLGDLDGFSTWFNGNIPVIFVNKTLPPDRYRLTVAHELARSPEHYRYLVTRWAPTGMWRRSLRLCHRAAGP